MKIYGASASGNCLKAKWTADYLGLAYEWIETSVTAGETRTEEFLARNPAGQVPCVEFDDGRHMAQSNAIIFYLAEREGSDLVPDEPFARARVLHWLFWEQHAHEPYVAERRFLKHVLGKPDGEIDPKLAERGNAALALMDRHLSSGDYFANGRFSVADISLVAYTRAAPDGGFDLALYPNVLSWIARIERDLDLSPLNT